MDRAPDPAAEARRLLAASPPERWDVGVVAVGDDGETYWSVGPSGTEAQAEADAALMKAAPGLLRHLADACERAEAAAKAAATCVHGTSPQLCPHCQRAFARGGHG